MTSDVGSFKQFCDLCASIRNLSGHKDKSAKIHKFLAEGSNGEPFTGDKVMLFRFLMPKEMRLVYNLKDKLIISLFSEIFDEDKDAMLEDLNSAEDAGVTIGKYFGQNAAMKPRPKSTLSMEEVNKCLVELSEASKDTDRTRILKSITKKATVDDLVMIIRLVLQDLRINAGVKQIMDGLHPKAYSAYQASRDLKAVIDKVTQMPGDTNSNTPHGMKKPALNRNISVSIRLMTPIKPMLAEACRSTAQAMAKLGSQNCLIAEIKYDGERVQIHKKGNKFAFYSRSLKPVPANKISYLESYIPQAFQSADDLILDSEVLLLDTKTDKPLPFGTLGVHKRSAFKDATVCLFVFDCLYLNGTSLISKPVSERRSILEQHLTEVKHRIRLSEKHVISDDRSLNHLMARVFKEGLEGLVLKPYDSVYEPGKRHWLKIKKDYLVEGAMADSVDLIVLGAYFGTGNKAGLMSVFLMGCYDEDAKQFCTVTKCGNGFTDEMLARYQKELKMVRVNQSGSNVPSWLNVAKSLVPDFVVADPKKSPVWEITGAEFSRANTHTAGSNAASNNQGISIRFPRMTKERPDKTWREATSVRELENLVSKSSDETDWLKLLNNSSSSDTVASSSSPTKKTQSSGKRKPEVQPSSEPVKRTKKPEIKPRHLTSNFDGVILEIDPAVLDDPQLPEYLKLLISRGSLFTTPHQRIPSSLVTSDAPTHMLVTSDIKMDNSLHPITTEFLKNCLKNLNSTKKT